MADQDSQRGSFWTSLPGILTGAAALITAISGLAVWHHNSPSQTIPQPAPVVQQSRQPRAEPAIEKAAQREPASAISGAATAAEGTQPWCAEKYKAWADEKAQSGVDDGGLRKELTRNHCKQYGFVLGKVRPQP